MATCKYCNEPIRWVATEGGKPMPINAVPDRNGNVVILPGGMGTRVKVLSGSDLLTWRGQLFMPHFATCPQTAATPMRPRRTET